MFRIAICEDEPLQVKCIVSLLTKYAELRPGVDVDIHSFYDASTLLRWIDAEEDSVDLFLLDIFLPDIDGITLARQIRARNQKASLVFLTASSDYALDAFKVNASQYIVKPINSGTLYPVLDDIAEHINNRVEPFFTLTAKKSIIKIPHRSIVCVELMNRILRFYLENGEVICSSTIRVSFTESISTLLEDRRFLFEHKSYAINMDYVEGIKKYTFVMQGGIKVDIPRYNIVKAKALYLEWCKQRGTVKSSTQECMAL